MTWITNGSDASISRQKVVKTIAGSGQSGYLGDGGLAKDASLNMPHELRFDAKGDLYIAERDNHVIRKVDMRTGVISTVAGTGARASVVTAALVRRPNSANLTVFFLIATAPF